MENRSNSKWTIDTVTTEILDKKALPKRVFITFQIVAILMFG